MAIEIRLDELLELGKRLCKEFENEDKNLLEMVDIKEFRHSAILGYLLGKTEGGHHIYLQSFLSRFPHGDQLPKLTGPKVRCEVSVDCGCGKRPIDILVEDGDFALIIENKCRGAIDQDLQIQDYWTGVGKLGHAAKDIFVLYLPALNAVDRPFDESLGAMKERFAPNGDLSGHLIVASYRELILPWLKEDVLPNVRSGSDSLVTSLRCYIDLLEGVCGERSGSRDIRNRLRTMLEKETKISDAAELRESTADLLRSIDQALRNKGSSENAGECRLSETDANLLTSLQSAVWQIRSVLREG